LQVCLEDKIRQGLEEISLQGGDFNPDLSLEFMFTEEGVYRNISYLCYTPNYYEPCVNQKPGLIGSVQEELVNYINSDVESCFYALAENYEEKGYEVSSLYDSFEMELMPKRIKLKINGKITYFKTEETATVENFEFVYPSHLYELLTVATEIKSQEATYCNFEHLGYMFLNPEFNIEKFQTSNSDVIYTIGYLGTNEKFRFVIRGCVFPPSF
jgi:hypothetical protein